MLNIAHVGLILELLLNHTCLLIQVVSSISSQGQNYDVDLHTSATAQINHAIPQQEKGRTETVRRREMHPLMFALPATHSQALHLLHF